MTIIRSTLIGITLTSLLAGCASSSRSIDTKSVDEYYREAQQEIRVSELDDAAKLIRQMEITYPFNPVTHKLLLDLAYAYSHHQRYSEAIAITNRFIAQYPYHDKVDYAYYIKALTNFNHGVEALDARKHPDPREANPIYAREAFKNFADLIRRFPKSQYVADAKKRMTHLRNMLAQHEITLARVSYDEGDTEMALQRAKYVLDNYPNTPAAHMAMDLLAQASHDGDSVKTEQTAATTTNLPKLQDPAKLAQLVADAQAKAPPTPVANPVAERNTIGPDIKPDIHGESWLLAQNPNHYTIQLAGTTRGSWLQSFFAEKQLGEGVAYYTSKRKGQTWYTALYGDYPSYQAAKRAIRELEQKTGIKDLWIRKYKDVQKQIQASATP